MKPRITRAPKGVALVVLFVAALFVFSAGVLGLTLDSSQASGVAGPSALRTARRLLDEGNIAEARKYFSDALKRNSKDLEALRGLALCAREEGDDESALLYFKQITALAPKDCAAWRQLALAAGRLGRDLEAISAAQTALSLSPGGDKAMSGLMNRLLAGDPGFNLPSVANMGGTGPRHNNAMRAGRGQSMRPSFGEVARPEVPDPTRNIPGLGKGR